MNSIDFEITHNNPDCGLQKADAEKILSYVSWKEKPIFPRRGRMAWHVLQTPLTHIGLAQQTLRAAKIKGVGAFNPPEEATGRDPILASSSYEPIPPTTEPLESFATYPHLGFCSDGNIEVVFGDTAPIGGILHERAVREFETAKRLSECGVLTIEPYLIVKYGNMDRFHGREMGAVVSLTPDAAPYRISEVQTGAALSKDCDPQRRDYYMRLLNALEVEGDPWSENTRLTAICILAEKVGRAMRLFSEAGLYRYSAEFPNFDFNFDKVDVVFTDLDSTHFLEDLPKNIQSRQVLRDAASMLYHLIAKFSGPTTLGAFSVRQLTRHDPLHCALRGYLSGASDQKIAEVTTALWRLYVPHFCLLNGHKQKIQNEWSQERRRSYKMDHHLFFLAAMLGIKAISDREQGAGLPIFNELYGQGFLAETETFLGARFEQLEFAMGDAL